MSPLGAGLVTAVVLSLLVAAAGMGVLVWRRRRAPALERRLRMAAAALTGGAPEVEAPRGAESIFRLAKQRSRLHRFVESGYPLLRARRAVPRAVAVGIAALGLAWFTLWFLQVPAGGWTLPIVGAAAFGGTWYALGWMQARQEAEFVRRFPEVVDQVVRLAGAGVPALEALGVAAEDAPEPVGKPLREVRDSLLAGLDADSALRTTSERLRMAEFTLFAAVIRMQRRAGGGVSGAFANLSATLRERSAAALKAHSSTAQTRLTLLVLSLMPIGVLIMQKFTAPQSVDILFGTEGGLTLLRWGTGLIVAGILVARAIAARGAQA